MKQLFSIFTLLVVSLSMNAQINLINSTTLTNSSLTWFNSNTKGLLYYETPDTITNVLKIYNENFTPYKSISINRPKGFSMAISCISEQLFNNDNSIEFICIFSKSSYTDPNGSVTKILLYDENNTIIKDFGTFNYIASSVYPIHKDNSTCLLLWGMYYTKISSEYKSVFQVYSLPGNLPNNVPVLKASNIKSAYPNPSNSAIILPYSLENNQNSTMKIFNINGQVVEQVSLSPLFDSIKLNVSSYSSGIYIYEYNGISNQFIIK